MNGTGVNSAVLDRKTKLKEKATAPGVVVVGLDFGSTFSGFAWASLAEPEKIHKYYEWPHLGASGGKHYCKTKTSLWYKAGASPGSFELQAWGYTANLQYSAAVQKYNASKKLKARSLSTASTAEPDEESVEVMTKEVGYLVTLFKSFITKHGPSLSQAKLPEGLTVQRMISDFLREIGELAMTVLQSSVDQLITKADVYWCISVPGIWEEAARQTMQSCVEMAGLVCGPACEAKCASPFPLTVVLEPEAASIYCQQKVEDVQFNPGWKFLVVDVGGFTVDLMMHEKIECSFDFSSSSSSVHSTCVNGHSHGLKMREVAPGSGGYCGGSIVDERFMKFLRKKISCYNTISKNLPESILKFLSLWESLKYTFDGTETIPFDIELPARLATAWEDHDLAEAHAKENGSNRNSRQLNSEISAAYDAISITVADMKNIFEPSVNKILALIEQQVSQVESLPLVMIVGGFSASPYLKRRITESFSQKVGSVVFPDEPGSAICCGAVVLGMYSLGIVSSRLARKTYGISVNRPFCTGDPTDHLMQSPARSANSSPSPSRPNRMAGRRKRESIPRQGLISTQYCRNAFDVFSRKGDEVPNEYRVTRKYVALTDNRETARIELYSSTLVDPKYISPYDSRIKKEGTFVFHHPSKDTLGSRPTFMISMYFGRTFLEVRVQGVNFDQEDNIDNKLLVPLHLSNNFRGRCGRSRLGRAIFQG